MAYPYDDQQPPENPGPNQNVGGGASPQARAYFNSLPLAYQQQVLASWGGADLMEEWYQNAVKAGAVPGQQSGGYQAEGEGGAISDWKNAAPWQEWMGKRKPTAQELRRWAKDTGRSEDYERFSDAAVSGWIERNWDVARGTFVNKWGDLVDKPDETGPNTPKWPDGSPKFNGTGDPMGAANAGGGGGGTAPAAAAAPTGGAGLAGSPASQAPSGGVIPGQAPVPQAGTNAAVGNTSTFMLPTAPPAQTLPTAAPTSLQPVPDAWKASGAAPAAAKDTFTPPPQPKPAGGSNFSSTGAPKAPGAKSDWTARQGNWVVASDARLKALGLELPAPKMRFSDWRK